MKQTLLALAIVTASSATAFAATPTPNSTNNGQAKVYRSNKLSKIDQRVTHPQIFDDQHGKKPFEKFHDETFELQLLQMRNDYPDQAVIFGGRFEADAQQWFGQATQNPAGGNYPRSGSHVFIHKAILDTAANINSWTTAFISVKASSGHAFGVNKAFVNFGNLAKTPFYASVGKDYLPFGLFSGGGPLTHSLTRYAFRPDETVQATAGYFKHGVNVTGSVLQDQHTNANFLLNGSYQRAWDQYGFTVGAGYLNDLRNTSSGLGSDTTIQNGRSMGAWDINGVVSYWQLATKAEYMQATARNPVAGNDGAARSWYIAESYTPTIYGKQTTFNLGFSRTYNMRNVPLPLPGSGGTLKPASGLKYQWVGNVTREVFHDTFLSVEYVYDVTYAQKGSNTINLDLDVYF